MSMNRRTYNLTAVIFSAVFLGMTLLRWSSIDTIDRAFYGFTVIGLLVIGLAPLLTKKKMNDQ